MSSPEFSPNLSDSDIPVDGTLIVDSDETQLEVGVFGLSMGEIDSYMQDFYQNGSNVTFIPNPDNHN